MLKISAVILMTGVFAGLLAAGPSGLSAADTGVESAAVKVKTFVVHEKAGVTELAQFTLPRADRPIRARYLHRPAVASKVRTMRGA